ncbi:hypothetical protein RSF51_000377 [Yersinia enterocolitica]|uniref:Uncharacterized protein n=2 Tax=Yersinia enterocolitica TaxID=630 RepID=A0A0T7NZD5_YEREN|nr:hypothetical protein [Yersinia enterocolitica]EKN3413101.1 hypothetical protein [Yersinia enterocolitica]EKN3494554.1 hypothetical protein [Yersinia enterocolitica]EKN3507315.1 hypothetical protein [Yersinia enterocolitica]EKN3555458.1 hypothetical protein [Yersinia enterocolitica]EKN3690736.1 hypothetical protein [Yersinia enterocolitica]
MSIAILIPTYKNHIPLNARFLKSVEDNCADDGVPDIFFATSSKEESGELSLLIDSLSDKLKGKVHCFDVEEAVKEYEINQLTTEYDSDATIFFRDGRCGIINLKKLSGVNHVFTLGFEKVAVLDSEILLYRDANLLKSLEKHVSDDVYRYSLAAYNHEIMTKIQNDSIRSVVWSFDSRNHFSRSYGWYENLCVYSRDKFSGFINHLTEGGDVFTNKFVVAASRFRGASFEWISYMAYRMYVLKEEIKAVCVDDLIDSRIDGHPWSTPQNENLYQYMIGDEEKDGALLTAVNPPWVPYTENEYTRNLVNKYLPDSCCLMFHLDRKHPGAEAEVKEEIPVPQPVIDPPPVISVQRRAINKLRRVIKRIALGQS